MNAKTLALIAMSIVAINMRNAKAEDVAPVVYDELRRVAAAFMRRERPGQTLATTALVHEAYLKLVDSSAVATRGRAYFFRGPMMLPSECTAMRSTLPDASFRNSTETPVRSLMRNSVPRVCPETISRPSSSIRSSADEVKRDSVSVTSIITPSGRTM